MSVVNCRVCGWQPIAPGEREAMRQLQAHFVRAHSREVAAEIPEGMVMVRVDGEWLTVDRAMAKELHERMHSDDEREDTE